ncbi:ABC transporter substrate-binding protein [Salinibacterium soli]|uniref:Sugar ABC transporter substrate-binding protein n=1 Tax=Antiquaquibacter soli TaxID=3064523 RepID=A0ABT9BPD3_9MICO|nr:sugar ABC transporter substrate-binding protein [Protaetiibacter sp. WY-16]MDO7882824.1 sugar ABC transporter substrate-binding protein [Protaetiibacter sp. WY-16]
MTPRSLRRLAAAATATAATAALLAGCATTGGTGSDGGPVTLEFVSWDPNMETIVDTWNEANPDIQVELTKPSESADELVTKFITQAQAGANPDIVKVEYQSLPALIANGVVVDLNEYDSDLAGKFDDASLAQVQFEGALYGVPQDFAPLVFFYRQDVFDSLGLSAPTTWDEYAAAARTIHAANPAQYLGTFSAGDPGWFAGLAQQAGANWWSAADDTWTVAINDAASKKVADYWQGLIGEGVIKSDPFWSTQWSAEMNDGTLVGWVSAAWAPAQFPNIAPDTAGLWTAAALPAWTAGDDATGIWGGSAMAVTSDSKHPAEATKFLDWLNTSDEALALQISTINVYPAATSGRSLPELDAPPAFMSNQPDYYAFIGQVAPTAKSFDIWGPNATVTFGAYRDDFGTALQNGTSLSDALDAIQATSVEDLEKLGFTVAQ